MAADPWAFVCGTFLRSYVEQVLDRDGPRPAYEVGRVADPAPLLARLGVFKRAVVQIWRRPDQMGSRPSDSS